ncbi:MAG: cytochrome c-type biogenesis protein CcmH [Sandarakinorhabdus sp.]|nr:cytochrome c-type biogenesis protein CcmH [Sandarakinorhabdus sp.]
MRALLALLFLLLALPAQAANPVGMAEVQLEDPATEARARALMAELRCLTCQNQSIIDSNAPQAQMMRVEVRERISAGEDPDEVRAWFVERYGDWVSFAPPARADTALLWMAPFLFLLLGGLLLMRRIKR